MANLLTPPVYDLVCVWPTIRALRVRTDHDMSLPERMHACLHELRLPITSLAIVIEWFLPPSHDDQSNLQILKLYQIPDGGRTMLSVKGALTTDKSYYHPILQEVREVHRVEILVNSINSSMTGTVVSKPEELRSPTILIANYASPSTISIPVLPR